ncbi:MAG: hypothetical protein ACFCUR_13770 [Rhodomicrobiaceae bacterium]
MHPMRLITYAVLTSVVTLIAMGGIGFYAGYSAGRGDLEELKTLIVAGGSPENAKAIAEALKSQSAPAVAAAPEVDLAPVLDEIRSMSAQIGKLEEKAADQPQVVEQVRDDPEATVELANVKQLLSEANDQYQVCRQNLTTLQTEFEELKSSATQQVALTSANARPSRDAGAVVLFDNVLLKRDENKLYRDVDVALSLESIASRSAKVAVNQQSVGIAFGERKIFRHRDVTCELQLMETDLEGARARLSIACKR